MIHYSRLLCQRVYTGPPSFFLIKIHLSAMQYLMFHKLWHANKPIWFYLCSLIAAVLNPLVDFLTTNAVMTFILLGSTCVHICQQGRSWHVRNFPRRLTRPDTGQDRSTDAQRDRKRKCRTNLLRPGSQRRERIQTMNAVVDRRDSLAGRY